MFQAFKNFSFAKTQKCFYGGVKMNNEKISLKDLIQEKRTEHDNRTTTKEIFKNEDFFKIAYGGLLHNNKEGIKQRIEFLKSYKIKNFSLKCFDMKMAHSNFVHAQNKQMGKYNQALALNKQLKILTRLNTKIN